LPKQRGSRIHAGLVGQRALVGTPYLGDPQLRREYVTEIAPRTTAALGKIFGEVFGASGAIGAAAGPRVLDLGAGTGAVGQATRAFFGAATEVTAVDRIAAPGVITADLTAPGPLRGIGGPFDLIIAAHLLNELFTHQPLAQRVAARADRILGWGQGLLAPRGTFILLEPALRETSRELLAVRDLLVVAGWTVVAPCLWQGACPALARERDWCHDAVSPGAAGRDGPARVDFSYLALRRSGAGAGADVDFAGDPALFRIVSDPLVEKGRLRFFGCGPAGRNALVRLDRHRTPANRAFSELSRGDLVLISGTTVENDGWRLQPETTVQWVASGQTGVEPE
jgi:hypothetical protein